MKFGSRIIATISAITLLHLLAICVQAQKAEKARCDHPNFLSGEEMAKFKAFLMTIYRAHVVRCSDGSVSCNDQAGHDELEAWLRSNEYRISSGSYSLDKRDLKNYHCLFGDGIGELQNINPPELDILNEGPVYVWGFDMKTNHPRPLLAETIPDEATKEAFPGYPLSTTVYIPYMASQLHKRMNKDSDPKVSEKEWVDYFVQNWRK